MQTVRLTTAQALTRFLINQHVELDDGSELPLFAGVWAIFGHGNVAGIGEALYQVQDQLPTYRGHNEQSMALAAIAFAKARQRQQVMVATTSIGPGATNLVTAAGVAYVNRLPVLLVPGDVFASGQPDPVLQQSENFADGSSTVNDTLRPVSRYFHPLLGLSNSFKLCLGLWWRLLMQLYVVQRPLVFAKMCSLWHLTTQHTCSKSGFGDYAVKVQMPMN